MRPLSRFIVILSIFFMSYSLLQGQVVETPLGRAEVIGLKTWTLQQVLDTLSIKAPGIAIDKCAAILKDVGFADASVVRYLDDRQKFYSVVTVIEPRYANFVKYKIAPIDTLELIPDWQLAVEIFKYHSMTFQIGLAKFGSNDILADSSEFSEYVNQEKVKQLWEFLSQHNKKSDHDLAIWILNNDGNYLNRVIAAAVLINFSENDLVWWNLMDSLRDPDARVSNTARDVLEYFIQKHARDINWSPAIISLNYLMNGTNLFAFRTVLKVLAATNLPTRLLGKLLADSKGFIILAHLKANHQEEKELAYNFLKKTTAQDFGYDDAKWEAYISSLIAQK